MRAILRRLESGERWWGAEVLVRTTGALLLAICAAAAGWTYRSANQTPAHPSSPAELAAAALAVACWGIGWTLLAEGPGMFRLIPVPGRHWMI